MDISFRDFEGVDLVDISFRDFERVDLVDISLEILKEWI